MVSCLVEWLEWVLGQLLIPQRLTVPEGGRGGSRGGRPLSCLLFRQEAGAALSGTVPPTFKGKM